MIATDLNGPRLAVDEILDVLSRPDRELQEIVELVASICGADAAGITIRRGDSYHVPITHGIDPLVCEADETFCRLTMATDDLYAVEDAVADPRFATIGLVDGRLASARAYASAPVYAPTGAMIGRLCVITWQPRRLSSIQLKALKTLADNVTDLVELRLLRAHRGPLEPATKPDATTVLNQVGAELSHDLRVPLTSVIASLELLRDELGDEADPVVTGLLERASNASLRMHRMVEQHLDHSSSTTHAIDRADLARVARQVVADAQSTLDAIGATVVVADLPTVLADPDDMYSVFQNLINNSIKFARPDVPVRLLLTARRTEGGWRVSVLDNGVGIPEDRRLDVFNLFSRVHASVAGHGIGLATVARIISSCGGQVGAGEAPGGGAEIWFELPELPR